MCLLQFKKVAYTEGFMHLPYALVKSITESEELSGMYWATACGAVFE